MSCPGILVARHEPVLAGLQLSNHGILLFFPREARVFLKIALRAIFKSGKAALLPTG
jgi:hypothetical protein